MRRAALGFLALAGCQQPAPISERTPREPIGRYQMMPNPGGEGFILLDTQTGFPRHCGVAPPQIACGKIALIPDM